MEAVCVGAVGEDARYYCMSWGCRQQWIAARLWGAHITCWKGMNGSQVRCRYWLILLGLLRNGGDEVEVWMIYL